MLEDEKKLANLSLDDLFSTVILNTNETKYMRELGGHVFLTKLIFADDDEFMDQINAKHTDTNSGYITMVYNEYTRLRDESEISDIIGFNFYKILLQKVKGAYNLNEDEKKLCNFVMIDLTFQQACKSDCIQL